MSVGAQWALALATLSLPCQTVFPLAIAPIHHLCRWNIFLKHGITSVKSFNEFDSNWRKGNLSVGFKGTRGYTYCLLPIQAPFSTLMVLLECERNPYGSAGTKRRCGSMGDVSQQAQTTSREPHRESRHAGLQARDAGQCSTNPRGYSLWPALRHFGPADGLHDLGDTGYVTHCACWSGTGCGGAT